MRFTTRLLSMTAAATAAVVGLAVTPASAAPISGGHVDGFDVDVVSGVLTLDIKTHSPANDDVPPAGTPLQLTPASSYATVVPSGSAWTCLGTAGSTIWAIPQAQNGSLLWLGWDTNDAAGQGPIKLELTGSTGPTGGRFTLFTVDSTSNPTYLLNTNSAAGCPKSVWPGGISAGVHGHGFWAFSATGTYTLTFKATAQNGAGATSGNVTYTFQV